MGMGCDILSVLLLQGYQDGQTVSMASPIISVFLLLICRYLITRVALYFKKAEEVSEGVLLIVPICSVVMIAILMYGALLVVFFPLRKNAGGFHAKTQMGCIFFSIEALFLDYYFWEQIIRIKMICVMVSAICCVSIFVLAPQGSRNKELDITEEKVY